VNDACAPIPGYIFFQFHLKETILRQSLDIVVTNVHCKVLSTLNTGKYAIGRWFILHYPWLAHDACSNWVPKCRHYVIFRFTVLLNAYTECRNIRSGQIYDTWETAEYLKCIMQTLSQGSWWGHFLTTLYRSLWQIHDSIGLNCCCRSRSYFLSPIRGSRKLRHFRLLIQLLLLFPATKTKMHSWSYPAVLEFGRVTENYSTKNNHPKIVLTKIYNICFRKCWNFRGQCQHWPIRNALL
jgi:hypothetical protein